MHPYPGNRKMKKVGTRKNNNILKSHRHFYLITTPNSYVEYLTSSFSYFYTSVKVRINLEILE